MRFLTSEQAECWAADRSPPLDLAFNRRQEGAVLCPGSYEKLSAGRVKSLGTGAIWWVSQTDPSEFLLWVREYGIWESEEVRSLEQLLRDRWPDAGTVETHPAMLADANDPKDRDDLVSFMYLAMNFGWGVTLAGDRGGRVVHANHDGHLWALALDPEARAEGEKWILR